MLSAKPLDGYYLDGVWQPVLSGLDEITATDDAPAQAGHHWVIPAEGVLDSVECPRCGRRRGIPGLKPTTPEEEFDVHCPNP